jgi:hypothetical protein
MVNRFTSAVNAPTQVASVNGTTGAAQTATRAMSGQATASPLPAAGVDAYFARLQKNERSVAVLGAHGEVTVRKEDWLADAL